MNTKEVGQILKSLGKNPTEGELVELVNYVDKDGTGELFNHKFPQVNLSVRFSFFLYLCFLFLSVSLSVFLSFFCFFVLLASFFFIAFFLFPSLKCTATRRSDRRPVDPSVGHSRAKSLVIVIVIAACVHSTGLVLLSHDSCNWKFHTRLIYRNARFPRIPIDDA